MADEKTTAPDALADIDARLLRQLESEGAAERQAALQTKESLLKYMAGWLHLDPNQSTFYAQLSMHAPALLTLFQRMFGI